MKQAELTLLEQMHITELEVQSRKELLGFTVDDAERLLRFRAIVRAEIDIALAELYERQMAIDDIALVIGDADTLRRMQSAQKTYVMDFFQGVYDIEYVNSRLHIGLVLKRIGIDPKLYLAATKILKDILFRLMEQALFDAAECAKTQQALDKLLYFDVTLVFETYVRSMVNEIELGKDRVTRYARSLEQRVAERTAELERLSRIDPLTGLFNRRILAETLQREIRIAERIGKPLSLIYFDVDRFKEINDSFGHEKGDDVLKSVGDAMRSTSRNVDLCFRLGGDEFCVVLTDSTEDEARRVYCDRLIRLVADQLNGLSLSIGIAQAGPAEYVDPDELIKRADTAMYEAKRRFHGPVVATVTGALVPAARPADGGKPEP
jgi:diguanylate cyclase